MSEDDDNDSESDSHAKEAFSLLLEISDRRRFSEDFKKKLVIFPAKLPFGPGRPAMMGSNRAAMEENSNRGTTQPLSISI